MTLNFTFPPQLIDEGLTSKGLDLIEANTLRFAEKNIPVLSGEVQFFRMDPDVWEACLDQVKNLGLPIVSTYLSWQRFSKAPGEFDLTGKNDPRLNVPRFLDMCRQKGLYVTLKPGPWICAEEHNGGYPDWLVCNPALQVLDAENRVVQGYNFPFQSPIPSYFHPVYQDHVRQWLEAVDEVIKPYCYPNGPIILVQLDNEPCFTFHDRCFESDYNPLVAERGGLYSRWLASKYGTPEKINQTYHSAYAGFDEITPPRRLQLNRMRELARYMDWAEFKETLFAAHVASIGQHHLRNGINRVLFTINYNLHPQLAAPNNWAYLEGVSGMGGYDYYPEMPMQADGFVDVVQAVNYSRVVNRVPWSPEIMCGIWNFAGQEHRSDHLKAADYAYLYLTCLAYGLKGMNFYMLADRDNWVNSPIDERGRLTETAGAVLDTLKLFNSVPSYLELKVEQNTAVLYYRPYAREAFISHETPCDVQGYHLGSAHAVFKQTYAALLQAGVNPALFDPDLQVVLPPSVKLLVAPLSPYMDVNTQTRLLAYVNQGGTLLCPGGLPAFDWDEKPAGLLNQAFNAAEALNGPGWKLVNIGAGRLLVLENAAPDAALLKELLERLEIERPVYAEDGRVKATLQKNAAGCLYFWVNTTNEAVETAVHFTEIKDAILNDVLSSGETLKVAGGKSLLKLPARSVKVFWQNHA
ncbi:MAG: beta-galactosidase [Anaerolineae bacterium]|nr:beta-galactosidase [Anaerolineae bacterium]